MRCVLLLLSQGLLALLLSPAHQTNSWRAAGVWWNVYGTIADLGCLAALRYFCNRESILIRDLLRPAYLWRGRDILLGLGYFLIVFPFFLGGAYAARILLYSSSHQNPNVLLVHSYPLPVWATIYGLTVWWLLWSPTEETTYQAYALPRFRALTGRTWIAFLIVGFFWAAQHCALPLILDWRFILYRFLSFIPGVLALMFFYWRKQRLAPLIFAHWPMDLAAAIASAMY